MLDVKLFLFLRARLLGCLLYGLGLERPLVHAVEGLGIRDNNAGL